MAARVRTGVLTYNMPDVYGMSKEAYEGSLKGTLGRNIGRVGEAIAARVAAEKRRKQQNFRIAKELNKTKAFTADNYDKKFGELTEEDKQYDPFNDRTEESELASEKMQGYEPPTLYLGENPSEEAIAAATMMQGYTPTSYSPASDQRAYNLEGFQEDHSNDTSEEADYSDYDPSLEAFSGKNLLSTNYKNPIQGATLSPLYDMIKHEMGKFKE